MVPLQRLFSYCCRCFDPKKLRNSDVVTAFLLKSGNILGIGSSNLFVRGATPTPGDPDGERIFKGGIADILSSIFADFVPEKNSLSFCVFYDKDKLPEGALDELSKLAEETFS